MIEQILARYRTTDWDFRSIAAPTDSLAHRFEQWVDYYRLKVAIAAVLRPATILEIGVRYGYSYAAFKEGHPAAHYVGIDLDTDTFGGEPGAIRWARQLAAGTGDEFVLGDTQKMERFPGATYDLIHIDGQQDGQGSYRDLELAIKQGRYLLVDGYLWTRDNCLSISEFLLRYREVVEYALIIPGYAGELLIKVNPQALERTGQHLPAVARDSESAREHYTEEYYLRDHDGGEEFARHRGRRLSTPRLQTLLDLALANRPRRLLDLGCGRGEITYHAARLGVEVTAVDYSPAAIALARSCFEGEPALEKRVEWICANAADLDLHGEYDAVVAGDLVARLTPEELDRMYATVSRHLSPTGRLIVHTSPSRWFHRYHYAGQRRAAAAVGAYLPAEPRSRHEKLMGINEQSPRTLRRQLRRYFSHVRLWFSRPDEPAGNLYRPMTRRELAACRDFFAVASPAEVEAGDLLRVLTMQPLSPEETRGVSWSIQDCPAQTAVGASFTVSMRLQNRSGVTIHSRPPCPVNGCYHWRDAASGASEVHDGQRFPLFPALRPGANQEYTATVLAPARPGVFLLDMTLVQENVRWFDEGRPDALATRSLEVLPAPV